MIGFHNKESTELTCFKKRILYFCSNPIIIHFCRNVMTKVTTFTGVHKEFKIFVFLTSNKNRKREKELFTTTIWDACCSCMLMELVTQASPCRYLMSAFALAFSTPTHKANYLFGTLRKLQLFASCSFLLLALPTKARILCLDSCSSLRDFGP
jgi:hypothetical protein